MKEVDHFVCVSEVCSLQNEDEKYKSDYRKRKIREPFALDLSLPTNLFINFLMDLKDSELGFSVVSDH